MDSSSYCALGFFIGALPFLLLWREAVRNGRGNREAISGYHRAKDRLIEVDRENKRRYHVR